MDSTATLIQTVRSRLEAGEHLAVRLYQDRGVNISLAESYDNALMRIHLNRLSTNVYQVHPPSEFTSLRRLLAQFRSQRRNRPKYLHAVLRGEPLCVTEFRGEGIWEFRDGNVPISSWATAILEDVSPFHFHWGHTATSAMISAWLTSIVHVAAGGPVSWAPHDDAIFTAVLEVLAFAGLIECPSLDSKLRRVTRLKSDSALIAKFTEVASALVEDEATQAEADAILARGLWRHRNEIREIDPAAMARGFAVAWQQDQSRAAARRGLMGLS